MVSHHEDGINTGMPVSYVRRHENHPSEDKCKSTGNEGGL
jgi:hypothetical protein